MSPYLWYAGHVECLAFALEHGADLQDNLLGIAIIKGRLDCVKLLVAKGLPINPYRPGHGYPYGYNCHFGPEQMRCLQYILDKGCAVDTGALISAARCGDVDLVRFLHRQNVPFWDCTWEECMDDRPLSKIEELSTPKRLEHCQEMNILAVPRNPQHANHMWKALFYSSVYIYTGGPQ